LGLRHFLTRRVDVLKGRCSAGWREKSRALRARHFVGFACRSDAPVVPIAGRVANLWHVETALKNRALAIFMGQGQVGGSRGGALSYGTRAAKNLRVAIRIQLSSARVQKTNRWGVLQKCKIWMDKPILVRHELNVFNPTA